MVDKMEEMGFEVDKDHKELDVEATAKLNLPADTQNKEKVKLKNGSYL